MFTCPCHWEVAFRIPHTIGARKLKSSQGDFGSPNGGNQRLFIAPWGRSQRVRRHAAAPCGSGRHSISRMACIHRAPSDSQNTYSPNARPLPHCQTAHHPTLASPPLGSYYTFSAACSGSRLRNCRKFTPHLAALQPVEALRISLPPPAAPSPPVGPAPPACPAQLQLRGAGV